MKETHSFLASDMLLWGAGHRALHVVYQDFEVIVKWEFLVGTWREGHEERQQLNQGPVDPGNSSKKQD